MKPSWKTLLRDTCRHRELSEEERSTFSGYSHLQRYFPGLDRFRQPSTGQGHPSSLELPSMYSIQQWIASDPKQPRRWKAMRRAHPKGGVSEVDASTESKEDAAFGSAQGAFGSAQGALEPCEVFVKVVHLLNPIECIRERYAAPPHPLLPHPASIWKHTVDKLHHVHNQAYVDTVANFVLSRFRELDLLPHCVLYYGSYTAISSNYSYNITDEYDTFRRHHWFWKAIRSYPSRLTLRHPVPSVKEQTYYQRLYQEITTCQVPASVASSITSSTSSALSASSSTTSLEELPSDSKEEDTQLTEDALQEWNGDCQEVSASDASDASDESDSDTDGSDASDASGISELEIFLEVPNVPVMMILQEAHEGVMDDLLDEEKLDGHSRGSREWERRWSAWMFQVIATLHFLQGTISFTHNDLHTNNMVWNKTDEPYLYYQTKDKTVWRVPTYGKIFRMIDFGRSIFRLGKHPWISGDHWPDEDAGGQYNYGPFYHPKKPKVTPNFSFDLCRLSVSLLSGLFDEPPPKKKAKKGQYAKVMSEEGSWKVYETQSELYNMLWEWTVDDAGRTVFETREGDEIYEGFDLYVHIAHHVHGAIPHEQYRRPLFQSYRWTNGVPDGKKVYVLP